MSNRIYLLIALAILIAAPIIVNVVSTALPPPSASKAQDEDMGDDAQEQEQAEADGEAEPALAPPSPGQVGSTEPVFDVQPSMDPAGIAPAPIGSEGGPENGAPRTSAPVREPITIAAPDQDAAPPPPPRPEIPASMNH